MKVLKFVKLPVPLRVQKPVPNPSVLNWNFKLVEFSTTEFDCVDVRELGEGPGSRRPLVPTLLPMQLRSSLRPQSVRVSA